MASAASGAAATWLQIRAGLRKNWLLTTRNKKELRVEATQTILLLLGVLFFSSLFSNDQRGDQLAFRPSTVYSLRPAALGGNVIGLAVQNGTCTPQLLSAVRAAASALPVSSVLCFPSPAAMEDRAVERNDVLAGFVLPSADPVEDAIQGRLSVVLRTNHTLLGNAPYGDAFTPAPYVSQLRSSLRGPAPSVFGGTFTALQAMLGEALLQLAADAREATSGERPWPNTTRALNLAVQQFPVPAHSLNLASNALRTLLPIYLTMIFSYQVCSARAHVPAVPCAVRSSPSPFPCPASLVPAAHAGGEGGQVKGAPTHDRPLARRVLALLDPRRRPQKPLPCRRLFRRPTQHCAAG